MASLRPHGLIGHNAVVPNTLVLLRHGQSVWNLENLFTGWVDVDLTDLGREEARRGGTDLARAGVLPDIVHTSVQLRAIRTAELALDECARKWIPVRRSWRLNERHYGDLQGKDKKETAQQFGAEQVKVWRRSYDVPPPPLDPLRQKQRWGYDDRYASLPHDVLPRAECLKDVLERMLPWWYDAIVPDLRSGATVLVAAHGNSLRALVKHLDGMTAEQVVELNLPTGEPLVYELDDDLRPTQPEGPGGVKGRYLDPQRALAAADAVARQAG
jgi:2,3-bisphosphoglycerate-dependent phosphoglycerate mutase